ncbi:hypothetical protein OFC41_31135, partial [Escherichia coli]|nr:hypothetical protein [Escherichia coli]
GTIIFTENGGREWRFANSEARDHLAAIAFGGNKIGGRPSMGVTVGTYGAVLISSDGGRNWTRTDSGTKEHLTAVDVSEKGEITA